MFALHLFLFVKQKLLFCNGCRFKILSMKLCLLAICIQTFFCLSASAQTPIPASKISIDNNWKFHLGNASDPAKDFNYGIANLFAKTGRAEGTPADPKFNDSSWQDVALPHDWAEYLPFQNVSNDDVTAHGYRPIGGLFPQNSIGWYRRQFSVAAKDSGQRFVIDFDGIFRDSKVWVNGIFCGEHWSGYTGASYDITDFISFHKPNIITVRADATQYEGWFYEGAGIYRHAWLNEYNNLHLVRNGGVFVYSNATSNAAQVSIAAQVENNNAHPENYTIQSYLTSREGKKLATSAVSSLSINVNGITHVTQTISLLNPHLWNLDDPYLYRVITLVKQGSKTIDSICTKTGIRTISISNKGLFVNGVYTKIHGTNNHQDHAGVGSALPDYLQYYRIHLLKEMGVNAYRTSHNAPTPELLQACDSLGMLVLDETRLLNSGDYGIKELETLILRDRNHPSVFLWSVGNEEFYIQGGDVGKRIAQTMVQKQKELDPTRTSTYAADQGNVFTGVNEVIPVRGFNYREKFVYDYHRDHPRQPIVGTEMGSTVTTRGIYTIDTVRAYVPDEDSIAPSWASRAEDWWKLCAPADWWMGGFVWTGFDYRGEPTPYIWPNVNSHFGIMDLCGFPKNIYYYYQSWWTDKDVLHISPHWNWKGKEGQPIDVWVNTNADNVELFLNGKSLGKKEMPRNSHLKWSVPYEAGTLEAVADKKGKKITSNVKTTGEAAEVVVTPYKTTMLADGKDVAVINITAIDKEGREVPDANNLIHFSITGDAKIIGVGNGDPSSHEADKCEDGKWQRSLFNGKCQLILQAGTTIDKIHFDAKADGLWTGGTDIDMVSANSTITPVVPATPDLHSTVQSKILGADISFLPELEDKGMKFSNGGKQGDAIEILKSHGINYIRLRIFNNPAADSGYSPGKGFCDLAHTLAMAKRVKAAGMKFLLDFHYSDYWADPGKQYKPSAWKNANFAQLRDSLYSFTRTVMNALKAQNTLPDMVQIGNEINHGMVWPEGNISHPDSLAALIYSGVKAVKAIAPQTTIMLHVALGGQYDEADAFFTKMTERNVPFDVIGLSYYPKWHGTLADLDFTTNYLAKKFNKDVVVVEYSQLKKEVNDIAFGVMNGRGKGSFIWEPLSTWEQVFDKEGKANARMKEYDDIRDKHLRP